MLDIVTYLTNKNLVVGDGADTFRDFTPNKPDSVVVLTEYNGSPACYYDSNVNRSIQVLVRDKDADIARTKALSIYKSLVSENLIVKFTETRWGQVHLRQTPFRLTTDDSNRVSYVFNVGITTTIE